MQSPRGPRETMYDFGQCDLSASNGADKVRVSAGQVGRECFGRALCVICMVGGISEMFKMEIA